MFRVIVGESWNRWIERAIRLASIDERASELATGDRRLGKDDAVGGGSSVGGHSISMFQNVDRHLRNDRIRRRQIVLSSNLYKLFVGTNERDLSIGRFQLECCSGLERIKRPQIAFEYEIERDLEDGFISGRGGYFGT